jgi:hypothetical protein
MFMIVSASPDAMPSGENKSFAEISAGAPEAARGCRNAGSCAAILLKRAGAIKYNDRGK